MEIKTTDTLCIITPLSPKLGKKESCNIFDIVKNFAQKHIGLDLSFVNDCTIDFISGLEKAEGVSLFNVHSDIFAIITAMNLDKKLKIYVSETDFEEEKRQILNRKFKIVY